MNLNFHNYQRQRNVITTYQIKHVYASDVKHEYL